MALRHRCPAMRPYAAADRPLELEKKATIFQKMLYQFFLKKYQFKFFMKNEGFNFF
jgi:hypothetical protein